MRVVPRRDLFVQSYTRFRSHYGETVRFNDSDAKESYNEFRPYRDANFEVERCKADMGVQSKGASVTRSAQTDRFRKVNFSSQYVPVTAGDLGVCCVCPLNCFRACL